MLEFLIGVSVLLNTPPKEVEGIVYDWGRKRYYWNAAAKFKKVSVYFDFDSAKLKEGEKEKLKVFKEGDFVIVKGFASPEAPRNYNFKLSLRRANAVKNFLEKLGVKVLKVKGFGESQCYEKKENWWKCRRADVVEVDK